VIIKGISCAGAARLAAHLTRTDTNERAEVKDIRGTVAQDLSGALKEMEAIANGARTTKPFYHASINTREDERLTDEQRMRAIDRLEEALGLTGQARVVVIHEKEGREHCHMVWSRIDLDRMAGISDSHNYRKHEEVARSLEREFGHERVQGVHVERDEKPRPERTPSHAEMLQAERTGMSTEQAKELMTETWRTTKSGNEFQAALEDKGWVLARGDRRDFVAIDRQGGIHSIARRIEGVKVADVRQRFADINPKDLRSVTEAKQFQRGRFGPPGPQNETNSSKVKRRRTEDEKAPEPSSSSGLEWTHRGGLVEQERAAMTWVKKSKERKAERTEQQDEASKKRQNLMRQLSREVSPEDEHDAKIEHDRGRERDRG
jgi:hypothetical protein